MTIRKMWLGDAPARVGSTLGRGVPGRDAVVAELDEDGGVGVAA
jgi:hypothetical protein